MLINLKLISCIFALVMISRTILITGATGLLGSHLCRKLNSRGDKIIALSTSFPPLKGARGMKSVGYDEYLSLTDEKIYGIINLAGKNLTSERWNEKVKKEIYDSRIQTTEKLINLISKMKNQPEVIVNASGVDYYGDKGSQTVYEDSPPGNNFAARLCIDWEKAALGAGQYGVRVVILRTGFVISDDAPGIKKMILPFKLFVGGAPGGGKQFLSWVHIDDITDIYLLALENKKMSGAYNACSPNPVTMKEFSKTLGKVLHRPSFMPVPAFGMKLLFGEVADLILSGRKALPKKLLNSGYKFRFPDLKQALTTIVQ